MSRRVSRLILALMFLAFVVVLACMVLATFMTGSPLAKRKLWNCFVDWPGLLITVFLIVVLVCGGWRVYLAVFARMSLEEVWAFFVSMSVLDLCAASAFETKSFSHEMLGWGTHRYLEVAGGNMLWSFSLTALVILAARPWRFVRETSLYRVVCSASGLLLVNYVVAFMTYVIFQNCDVQ